MRTEGVPWPAVRGLPSVRPVSIPIRVGPYRRLRAWRAVALAALWPALAFSPTVVAEINPRYFDGDWQTYTALRHVTSFAATPEILYFGTRGGVARYDRFAERWLPAMTTAEGLRANTILRMAFNDLTEEVYAETVGGVSVYHRSLREWRDAGAFPEDLMQDWQEVDLTQYNLPFGYDALEEGLLTDPHLRSYPIQGALEDSWGNLWVATWGEFVWMRPLGTFDLTPQRWGLFHNNVEAIFLDSGTIFFGGTNYYAADGALSIYDTVMGTWQYIESRFLRDFPSDRIRRFAGEPGGRYLWMATDVGVVRLDRQTGKFRGYGLRAGLSDDRVLVVHLDGDILWVGTETGIDAIYLPNDSVFSAATEAVENAKVYTVDVTGEVVWLGTDRGLYRLAKPFPEWARFSTGLGPLAGRVRALRHDERYLYVGSDRGIAVVDLRGLEAVKTYEYPTALPDGNVFDLAVTDSILWVATPSGLIRYVPATAERRVMTTADGLVDLQIQTIVADGDYLWLGTPSGVSRFRWKNPYRID